MITLHNIAYYGSIYFAIGQVCFISDYFYATVIKGKTRNEYLNEEITVAGAALVCGLMWPLYIVYLLINIPFSFLNTILDKIDFIADKKHKRLNHNIVNKFKVD